MANLLHLIVSLVDDPAAREAVHTDPESMLGGLDDLTGEDVAAAADVARVQVEPDLAHRLTGSLDLRRRGDETDRDVAIRALRDIASSLER